MNAPYIIFRRFVHPPLIFHTPLIFDIKKILAIHLIFLGENYCLYPFFSQQAKIYGQIVAVKRNGKDGGTFLMSMKRCLIGR